MTTASFGKSHFKPFSKQPHEAQDAVAGKRRNPPYLGRYAGDWTRGGLTGWSRYSRIVWSSTWGAHGLERNRLWVCRTNSVSLPRMSPLYPLVKITFKEGFSQRSCSASSLPVTPSGIITSVSKRSKTHG